MGAAERLGRRFGWLPRNVGARHRDVVKVCLKLATSTSTVRAVIPMDLVIDTASPSDTAGIFADTVPALARELELDPMKSSQDVPAAFGRSSSAIHVFADGATVVFVLVVPTPSIALATHWPEFIESL